MTSRVFVRKGHRFTHFFGLSVLLMGCGQISIAPDNTALPEHLNALTLGSIDGRIASRLQNVSLTRYENQQIKDYDLFIVDGDKYNSEEIKKIPQVNQALASHIPILFTDLNGDHKKNSLKNLIGFSTPRSSNGYLLVPVEKKNGKDYFHIYETFTPRTISNQNIIDDSDTLFAKKIASNIKNAREKSLLLQENASGVGPIQAKWILTESMPLITGSTEYGNVGQQGSATINRTYTLYQDLSQVNATQDLVVSTSATVDPGQMASNANNDKGWFLSNVGISSNFLDAATSNFKWFDSGPIAQNNTNQYTSGTSFNIGFSGFDAEASLSYNSSKTWSINDWSVNSDISGNSLNWRFKSSNPDVDVKCQDNTQCSGFSYINNALSSPNSLSTSQSEYNTEVVYKNDHLSSDTVTLSSQIEIGFKNFYHGWHGIQSRDGTYFSDGQVIIDLSSVIPQDVAMIFDYDVAPSNTTFSGIVSIPNPAVVPANIYLRAISSADVGVTVPPYVTIPAGASSVSFPISTNVITTNGNSSRSSITLQSLYGNVKQSTIALDTSNNFLPPQNNLTYGNYWYGVVYGDPYSFNIAPADSEWRMGYSVRYAISYIDSKGKELVGPYSAWIGDTDFARPLLINLPSGPSGTVARRVYRQFLTEAQRGQQGKLLSPDVNGNSLADNTTTTFQDMNW
ncbi:hypothetical protein [Deinococcus sp. Leaf326]|uniref:hypothetical protein n=1 Tax=Deinococcus sp. Leaf326 TaxID=1736338 RepID=UPI000A4CCF58|nr:hypothetical protein [Deinococcus sp. Leaf326]